MSKIICSPGSYIQGKGEFTKLATYYADLGSKGAYLIIDKFIHDTYLDEIASSFEQGNVPYEVKVFGGECCDEEIDAHAAALGTNDAVFGIGGGKTLDTAKSVAHKAGLPVIIVPTAASTDAPCSRLAVIYTKTGEFDRYLPLPKNPDIVVVDTEVVAKAPKRFLMAGIGDAFATYYEAAACKASDGIPMTGGHITLAAITLARLCLDTLLADGLKAKAAVEAGVCTTAVENIIEANTYLSGIGFESSGLAAAHAIHNGLTCIEETHKFLHGEKVAFGAVTQLVLENRPTEELESSIRFLKACELPVSLSDLGIADIEDERLMQAARDACAEGDTMGNMPFEVTPEDVFAAMKAASRIADAL